MSVTLATVVDSFPVLATIQNENPILPVTHQLLGLGLIPPVSAQDHNAASYRSCHNCKNLKDLNQLISCTHIKFRTNRSIRPPEFHLRIELSRYRFGAKRGYKLKRLPYAYRAKCKKQYCISCLVSWYGYTLQHLSAATASSWVCLSCRNLCHCRQCSSPTHKYPRFISYQHTD